MEFKFKKGDQVRVTFGPTFGDPNAPTMFCYKITARKSKGMSGGPEYRLGSLSGWWAEHNLVLASQPTKNSPDCNEAERAITYTPKETKCDTEDSGEPENLWDVISELSDIRAGFSVFDDEERAKYHALSVAIEKLREELIK